MAEHLLPDLAAKIADAKVVVRRAASQALVAYMYSTRDKETVVRCLLHSGLESSEWRSRQATALFLSLPTTPLDAVNSVLQFELLCATISLLSDRVDAVTTSAKQALSQLRVAFADEFEVLGGQAMHTAHSPNPNPNPNQGLGTSRRCPNLHLDLKYVGAHECAAPGIASGFRGARGGGQPRRTIRWR